MRSATRLSLFLLIALILLAALSLLAGKVWISPSQALSGDVAGTVVMALRAPRVALAIIIGGGLAMAGAAMQGYLRNPLADPGLFGVSSSAALGAVCALFFGYAAQAWLLPGFALIGAALGMGALLLIAGRGGGVLIFTLGGVMLSSLTGALTALMISLSPSPFAVAEIVHWMMGALIDRSWADVALCGGLTLLGGGLLWLCGRGLDALTLGEDAARSLGVNLGRLQIILLIGVGLIVGASVAVAGVIGFVGLVVPHVVRPFVGGRPSALLLPSALAGAVLLLLADTAVRIAPMVSELRLGVAMSLLGAPFFLWLLWRLRREMA